jgi:hypothetical protein
MSDSSPRGGSYRPSVPGVRYKVEGDDTDLLPRSDELRITEVGAAKDVTATHHCPIMGAN